MWWRVDQRDTPNDTKHAPDVALFGVKGNIREEKKMDYYQLRQIEDRLPRMGGAVSRAAWHLINMAIAARKARRHFIMPRYASVAATLGICSRSVLRAVAVLAAAGVFRVKPRFRRAGAVMWRMSNLMELMVLPIVAEVTRSLAAFPPRPLFLRSSDNIGRAVTGNNAYRSVRTGAGSLYAALMQQGLRKNVVKRD